jgi:rubrerythrin
MFTLSDLLDIAIKLERNGEALYAGSLDRVGDAGLRDLLEWMASEEAAHLRMFHDMKSGLTLSNQETALRAMLPSGVLEGMIGDQAFSLDDVDFGRVGDVVQLLQTFIGFEEETIQFYGILALYVEDPAAKAGLESIIREEEGHVQKLKAMLQDL